MQRLERRAGTISRSRIHFPGKLSGSEVRDAWCDFDCVVHVPTSENCGGVIEPLLARRLVVASRVGGLPEVIKHGETGFLLPELSSQALSETVLAALEDPRRAAMGVAGEALVREMFDVGRTAPTVLGAYRQVLGPSSSGSSR